MNVAGCDLVAGRTGGPPFVSLVPDKSAGLVVGGPAVSDLDVVHVVVSFRVVVMGLEGSAGPANLVHFQEQVGVPVLAFVGVRVLDCILDALP